MQISSLSDYEFVCLVAHYNSVTSDSNVKSDDELRARGFTSEAIAEVNKQRRKKFNSIASCGLRFTEPFEHLRYEPMGYVYTLFENYQLGCLPFPGSTSEQPAQIMEIFSILQRLKAEAETKAFESVNRGRNQHKNKPRARR